MSEKNFVSYGDAETIMSEVADKIADAKESKGYIQIGKLEGTTPNATATVEGVENTGSGENAHAEGYRVVASGANSHAGGYKSTAAAYSSHAGGGYIYATEDSGGYNELNPNGTNRVNSDSVASFVHGIGNTVTNSPASLVTGSNNVIESNDSEEAHSNTIIGYQNTIRRNANAGVPITGNFISGRYNEITNAKASFAVGDENTIDNSDEGYGAASFAIGHKNTMNNAHYGAIIGQHGTITNSYNSAVIADDWGEIVSSGQSATIGASSSGIDHSNKCLIGASADSYIHCTSHGEIIGSYNSQIASSKTSQYGWLSRLGIINSSISNIKIESNRPEKHSCTILNGTGCMIRDGGSRQFLGGYDSEAGDCSDQFVYGYGLNAKFRHQTVFGRYNRLTTHQSGDATGISNNSLNINEYFTIGDGEWNTRANCFRVGRAGVYGTSAFNAAGADYAEMFEWQDANTNDDDRRGLFVTLDGDKIKFAESEDDFILGVVSGNPSIVGDVHDDQYKDMFVRDIFGAIAYETIEVPEKTIDKEVIRVDENGKEFKEYVKETIPAHTKKSRMINPDYDDSQTYIPRSNRPEWSAVGMMGKLVLCDDGTAEVNGWVKPSAGGIGTKSETRTKYRVMERLDDSHVRILILP